MMGLLVSSAVKSQLFNTLKVAGYDETDETVSETSSDTLLCALVPV